MEIVNMFLMVSMIGILWRDFMDDYGDGDGEREAGVAEDENIEIREGTGETREVEEEMIWRDSASSRDGRISEESDTNSDAASGDVQSFPPRDDDGSLYELDSMDDEDDGDWEAGGREDENIENQEGTRDTTAVGKKRPRIDNASSRDGRISEDSDTDSDVASGVVQSFPHQSFYGCDSMDDEDDGEQGAGGREDENIEYIEGTGETREAGKKRTWSDNASRKDGRNSEESDTDLDVASGNVQSFPYDESHVDGDLPEIDNPRRGAPPRRDDCESFEDDGENVGLEQQPDAESLVRASRTLSNPRVADFVEEIDTEGNTNHNQEQQHTVATDCVVVQETIHEIADGVAESNGVAVSLIPERCLCLSAEGFVALLWFYVFFLLKDL